MFYIMAETFSEAERAAQEAGLTRSRWRCLHDEAQLLGAVDPVIWLVGAWRVPPNAARVKLFCDAMGYQSFKKEAPLFKRREDRKKRRIRDKESGLLVERK